MQGNYKHSELTERIIGCAMKVHRYFGPGFREEIYERSLMIELKKERLNCSSQIIRDIFYEEERVGHSKLDLLVEGKVLVELKAVSEWNSEFFNKILNYLNVFKIEVGLLINFGTQSLQFKRFVYKTSGNWLNR